MVAYNRSTVIGSGIPNRRVVSGPSILGQAVTQSSKDAYPMYLLPPYTPWTGDKGDLKPYIVYHTRNPLPLHKDAEPIHSPEIFYETAPTMQRGGPYKTRQATSCPPLGLGLGPSIDFRRGQSLVTPPTEEEKLLVRGRPPIVNRGPYKVAYFTAVQEFANYARAKTLVERGFIQSQCDPMVLLKGENVYDPPMFAAPPVYSSHDFVGVEVNGFLFQDRRGSSPSYFGYRWL